MVETTENEEYASRIVAVLTQTKACGKLMLKSVSGAKAEALNEAIKKKRKKKKINK